MTFHPNQVVSNEQWRERHKGHRIVESVSEVSIKRFFFWTCEDCGKKHLWKMETITDGEDDG